MKWIKTEQAGWTGVICILVALPLMTITKILSLILTLLGMGILIKYGGKK